MNNSIVRFTKLVILVLGFSVLANLQASELVQERDPESTDTPSLETALYPEELKEFESNKVNILIRKISRVLTKEDFEKVVTILHYCNKTTINSLNENRQSPIYWAVCVALNTLNNFDDSFYYTREEYEQWNINYLNQLMVIKSLLKKGAILSGSNAIESFNNFAENFQAGDYCSRERLNDLRNILKNAALNKRVREDERSKPEKEEREKKELKIARESQQAERDRKEKEQIHLTTELTNAIDEIQSQEFEDIRELLNKFNQSTINCKDRVGETPIYCAASKALKIIGDFIRISKGTDQNYMHDDGIAGRRNEKEETYNKILQVIKLLLERGADMSVVNKFERVMNTLGDMNTNNFIELERNLLKDVASEEYDKEKLNDLMDVLVYYPRYLKYREISSNTLFEAYVKLQKDEYRESLMQHPRVEEAVDYLKSSASTAIDFATNYVSSKCSMQ